MLKLNLYGKEFDIYLTLDNYLENDNLYVGMITTNEGYPEPFGDLTVNIGIKCEENYSYIDVNNNPNIIQWLIDNNLGISTGNMDWSGCVLYPEFKFNIEEVNKHLYKEKIMEINEFKMYIDIYEPMLNGGFEDTQPHEYLWKSDHLITDEEFGKIKNLIFEDIIFQACEIERLSNGELCIEFNVEKNDEFYDHEQIFIKVNLIYTDELSEYIVWDKCPNLPPIYKIDREKSTIEILDD